MSINLRHKTRWTGLQVAIIVLMTLSACSTTTHSSSSTEIAKLAELFEGRFDTHKDHTSAELPKDQRFTDSRQRVAAPTLGEYVYYLQLNRGDQLKLYRQRLLILETDSVSGNIVQRSFTLLNPQKFTDARAGDPVLSNVTAKDIKPMFEEGCGQIWKQTPDGFYGHVDPSTCRIFSKRRDKYRRIEAETWLTSSTLALAERGFDDNMKQEFGTAPGDATLLHRLTTSR